MGRTKSKICPDCGSSYANKYAHAEACPGRLTVPAKFLCGAMVYPEAFNVRYPCSLPAGHRGPHR